MADLTPDQLETLLEEKLRPIHAKLDALAQAPASRPPGRLVAPRLLAALALTLLTVVAVLLVGRFVLASSDTGANQVMSGPGRLLYSDDFNNVPSGLFLGRQDSTAFLPGDR